MSKTFIEKRVIQAGRELCERRIDQKGTMITADDIHSLKVKTFPPIMQSVYITLGTVIFVLGLWVQMTRGNMANLMALTAEIVSAFVEQRSEDSGGRG